MKNSLPSYTDYKETDVPWLRKVPSNWEIVPGRACYREKKVSNEGLQEKTVLSLSYGKIVIKPPEKLHGLVPESFETYQIISPGDIICRPTDLQNDRTSLRFGLNHHRGIITSAYMCLTTKQDISRNYGHLLLHAYDLKKVFYGLGSGLRQNLSWEDFKYLPCLLPSEPEQRAIARYLDWADERIQRLIEAREKQIEYLEEYKQAIIQQAVTGQIDVRTGEPYPDYKDSGVEWLGQVPKHWKVRRLKYLASIETGERDTANRIDDGKYPFFVRSQIIERINTYSFDGEAVLTAGDGAGVAKVFHYINGKFDYHQRVYKFSDFQEIMGRYFFYYVREFLGDEVLKLSAKSTVESLRLPMLQNFPVVIPNPSEQKAIVNYIGKQAERIDLFAVTIKQEIEFLREYRTRLIADVVTGKVDVRQTAANLPDIEPRIDD